MDTGSEAGPCSLGVLIQLRGVISPSVWTQPWSPWQQVASSSPPQWSGLEPKSGLRPQQPHRAGPYVLISELLLHPCSVPSSCSQPSSAILNHETPSGPPCSLSCALTLQKSPRGPRLPPITFLPTSSCLTSQLLPAGGRVQLHPTL